MKCLFCNSELNYNNICANTNHYFYLDLDKNIYTLSYLVKEDIELLLYFSDNIYRFLILRNTDCRENNESIFDFALDEEEYFKINNLDIFKIKNLLKRLYELNMFI